MIPEPTSDQTPNDAPRPLRPRRVVVAGSSGSGKSTLARRISRVLDLPYVEMDGLRHGPGFTERPTFVAEVEKFTAGPAWVTEYQYEQVRPMLRARADVMVYLLLPRHLVMWRVVRRTLSRRWRRTQLWNGNVEPPLRTIVTDPEHIIRWAWTTWPEKRDEYAELAADPDLVLVPLRSRREIESWLRALAEG